MPPGWGFLFCGSMPTEVGPDVGAALAAGLADEPTFNIGEPDIVRPSVATDRDGVAASAIRAINQDTANAGFAHLAKGDLLRALGHLDQSIAAARFIANRGRLVARSVRIVSAAWCVIRSGSASACCNSTGYTTIIASTIVASAVDATAIYTRLINGNSS